jgi:hypothetical protein
MGGGGFANSVGKSGAPDINVNHTGHVTVSIDDEDSRENIKLKEMMKQWFSGQKRKIRDDPR